MKSHSINFDISRPKLEPLQQPTKAATRNSQMVNKAVMEAVYSTAKQQVLRASAATLVIMTILVGAIWGSQDPMASRLIEVMLWAGGFVFLALAVDSNTPRSIWLLATGVALPILALLGSGQAIEFTLIAAVLVAIWAGYAIISGWKEV